MAHDYEIPVYRTAFGMDNGQLTVDNCGISLREMIEIVAKGDTIIAHYPLSIVNYLSGIGPTN